MAGNKEMKSNTLLGHFRPVSDLFSRCPRTLVTELWNLAVSIWDTGTGEELHSQHWERASARGASRAPKRRVVVSQEILQETTAEKGFFLKGLVFLGIKFGRTVSEHVIIGFKMFFKYLLVFFKILLLLGDKMWLKQCFQGKRLVSK